MMAARWEENLCPKKTAHVLGPDKLSDWVCWSDEMLKSHQQKRCDGCGLWLVWVKESK